MAVSAEVVLERSRELRRQVHCKKQAMLSEPEKSKFLNTLRKRFEGYPERHSEIHWSAVLRKLESQAEKLNSLYKMESSGGQPDVVSYDSESDTYTFFDCSPESPKGRRSLCYDREALESRKKYPPKNSALDLADDMGVKLLTEKEYRRLQELGDFDTKTSSWLQTPTGLRELGGALFGDFRYGRVFIYHNGAQSYYAARGFRAKLEV